MSGLTAVSVSGWRPVGTACVLCGCLGRLRGVGGGTRVVVCAGCVERFVDVRVKEEQ